MANSALVSMASRKCGRFIKCLPLLRSRGHARDLTNTHVGFATSSSCETCSISNTFHSRGGGAGLFGGNLEVVLRWGLMPSVS